MYFFWYFVSPSRNYIVALILVSVKIVVSIIMIKIIVIMIIFTFVFCKISRVAMITRTNNIHATHFDSKPPDAKSLVNNIRDLWDLILEAMVYPQNHCLLSLFLSFNLTQQIRHGEANAVNCLRHQITNKVVWTSKLTAHHFCPKLVRAFLLYSSLSRFFHFWFGHYLLNWNGDERNKVWKKNNIDDPGIEFGL